MRKSPEVLRLQLQRNSELLQSCFGLRHSSFPTATYLIARLSVSGRRVGRPAYNSRSVVGRSPDRPTDRVNWAHIIVSCSRPKAFFIVAWGNAPGTRPAQTVWPKAIFNEPNVNMAFGQKLRVASHTWSDSPGYGETWASPKGTHNKRNLKTCARPSQKGG